jgi:hypothetical protein
MEENEVKEGFTEVISAKNITIYLVKDSKDSDRIWFVSISKIEAILTLVDLMNNETSSVHDFWLDEVLGYRKDEGINLIITK